MRAHQMAHAEVYGSELLEDRLKPAAALGLYARIADHADDNYTHYTELLNHLSQKGHELDDESKERVLGYGTPSDFVAFLRKYPVLGSIEIARRTHPGRWDTGLEVDAHVRADLDARSEELDTQRRKSVPHYKIKGLGYDKNSHPMVERKRIVRTHFGGELVTVVRNSLLIDMLSQDIPADIKDFILYRRDMVKNAKQEDGEPAEYDYDEHSDFIKDALEPHMEHREIADKPRWAVPQLTTYYTPLICLVKPENRVFEDEAHL